MFNLIHKLWDVGAVLIAALNPDHPLVVRREGPHGEEFGFLLKMHEADPSKPLSPYYLDLRTPEHHKKPGPVTPEIIDLGARCLVYAARELTYDAAVGLPDTGGPFAAAFVRHATGKELIRLTKFEHGKFRCIGGLKDYDFNATVHTVLPIDDVISAGDTKDEAVFNLRNDAFEVNNLVVIVDRQEGGREKMAKLGCQVHEVFTATELFGYYADTGKINKRVHRDIKTYIASVSPA